MSRPVLTEVPVPKYRIGQTVYRATTTTENVALPCPDCLGKRTWEIVTPGGTRLETPCLRCQGYIRNLPSLHGKRHVPAVVKASIASVRIDTGTGWSERDYVEYTLDNAGSGSYYGESQLYDNEALTLEVATAMAHDRNKQDAASPERLEDGKLNELRLDSALTKELEMQRYKARRLADRVKDLVDVQQDEFVKEKGNYLERSELLEELESLLRHYTDATDIGEETKEETDGRIIRAIEACLNVGLEVGYTEEDGDEYRVTRHRVVGGCYSGTFDNGYKQAARTLFERWDGDCRP